MILRRLALRDFRRFADFTVEFGPGFNVVLGHNEEGKSSLREALALALFENPRTSNRKVLAQQRWGAAEPFALSLEFAVDGEEYRLAKDFQAKSALLEGTGGLRLHDPRQIEAQVQQFLGLGSRALFASTVCISQRDLASIQERETIADSLQRTVTGGEQDVLASAALEQLDRALTELKRASRASPGPLYELPASLEEQQRDLSQAQAELARGLEARRQLALTERELAETQSLLAEKQAQLDGCARRLRLEGELTAAEREEAALARREEEAQRRAASSERRREELAKAAGVLALSAAEATEVAVLARRAAEPAAPVPPRETAARTRWPVLALGGILLLAGLAGALWQPDLAALALAGLGLLAWEVARGRRSTVAAASAELLSTERHRQAAEAGQALAGLLGRTGCASAVEFAARRARAEELQRQLGQAEAELKGWLGELRPAELALARRQASLTAQRLRDALDEPAMHLARLEQAAYLRLQAEVNRLVGEAQVLDRQQRHWQAEALAARTTSDQVHEREEQVAELQSRLQAARERQQALQLARTVLDEARQATLRTAKEALEGELGSLVAAITAGRYTSVAVAPAGLELAVRAPGRAEPVPVAYGGELSTGTVEQIYLAARLALARLLAGGRRPPLILDDPFLAFDDARTRAVLALCRRLATETQVLLFSCRPDYSEYAERLIELPPL